MDDVIRCAFTDKRVETCSCGRHPQASGGSWPGAPSGPRHLGVRQFGVVDYDDHDWTIHTVECHHYTNPHGGRRLRRLRVNLDEPPPMTRYRKWRMIRSIRVCQLCKPLTESELHAWQFQGHQHQYKLIYG